VTAVFRSITEMLPRDGSVILHLVAARWVSAICYYQSAPLWGVMAAW
jgi:hypothetical protein